MSLTLNSNTNYADKDIFFHVLSGKFETVAGTGLLHAVGPYPGYVYIEHPSGRIEVIVISCSTWKLGSAGTYKLSVQPIDPNTFHKFIGSLHVSERDIRFGEQVFERKSTTSSLEIYFRTDLSISWREITNSGKVTRFYVPEGMTFNWFLPTDKCIRTNKADPLTGYPISVSFNIFYPENFGLCVAAQPGFCAEGTCQSVPDDFYGNIFQCTNIVQDFCMMGCPDGTVCGLQNGVRQCVPAEVTCRLDQMLEDGRCVDIPAPCNTTCAGNCFNPDVCPEGTICARTAGEMVYSCTANPYFPPEPLPELDDNGMYKWIPLVAVTSGLLGLIFLIIYVFRKNKDENIPN